MKYVNLFYGTYAKSDLLLYFYKEKEYGISILFNVFYTLIND